jgi:hypothetical protein
MNERQYFEDCVTDLLGDKRLASEYEFLIASDLNDPADNLEPIGLVPGRKPVLLYLSRETGIPVSLKTSARFHTVFQGYLSMPRIGQRVFPLQIGAVNNRWYCERPSRHAMDSNIFFAGMLTRARARLLTSISEPRNWRTVIFDLINHIPKSSRLLKILAALVTPPPLATGLRGRMIFASRWKGGLTAEQYKAQFLDAAVVLCPAGNISVETFRVFEAASAGCAIVTERLPDTYGYRGNPFIEVDSITGWLPALLTLVSGGEDALMVKGEATREFWEKKLSPSATADYIRRQLNSKAAL